MKERELYKKLRTRSPEVMRAQICETAERIVLPSICGGVTFYEVLFSYVEGKGNEVYYNFTDPNQDPSVLTEYFNKNEKELFNLSEEAEEEKEEFKKLFVTAKKEDFELVYGKLINFWAKVAVFMALGGTNRRMAKEELSKIAYLQRAENDKIIYEVLSLIMRLAREKVPEEYKEHVNFLAYEEIVKENYPSIDTLKQRKKGYTLFKAKISTGITLEEFINENNIIIEGLNNLGVRGNCASPGIVKGRARIVLELPQLSKLQKGDILVTPMTTPDFLPHLEKVGGIITDEGGILCHAAIASREFKVPCIVGTEVATSVLKDGDLIEIDGEKGTVRRIL